MSVWEKWISEAFVVLSMDGPHHRKLVGLGWHIVSSSVPFQRLNGLVEELLEYSCEYRKLEMEILVHYREMYSPLTVAFDSVEYSDSLKDASPPVVKVVDDYHT
jgi:hypothetical protein